MTRRQANIGLLSAAAVAVAGTGTASEARVMQLPSARTAGGKLLIEALRLRRSTREYSSRPLEAQMLSDLLWSAYGINRPTGDRTAPYWRHAMVIDVFAVMASGTLALWPKDSRPRPAPAGRASRQNRTAGLRRRRTAESRRMVNACTISRLKIGAYMRRLMPVLSDRMSICSAHPRGSQPCFAVQWIIRPWQTPCI